METGLFEDPCWPCLQFLQAFFKKRGRIVIPSSHEKTYHRCHISDILFLPRESSSLSEIRRRLDSSASLDSGHVAPLPKRQKKVRSPSTQGYTSNYIAELTYRLQQRRRQQQRHQRREGDLNCFCNLAFRTRTVDRIMSTTLFTTWTLIFYLRRSRPVIHGYSSLTDIVL